MIFVPNYHVFGTGFGLDIPETLEKGASITAVRGPLSRDMLLDYGLECPEMYGDAALLCYHYTINLKIYNYKIR